MDKRQLIGLVLIFGLFMVWSMNNSKIRQQIEHDKFVQDSISQVERNLFLADSIAKANVGKVAAENTTIDPVRDSLESAQLNTSYGAFGSNMIGQEEFYTLSNDKLEVKISNKGGRIVDVWLKDYQRVTQNEKQEKTKSPLHYMDNKKDRFSYMLPVNGVPGNEISTEDLYFTAAKNGNSIKLTAANGAFVQEYSLKDDYALDYNLAFDDKIINKNEPIRLYWNNHLKKIELNDYFERFYSTAYFKEKDENSDYCNCRKDDVEEVRDNQVEWISNSNQFFNSSIIAKGVNFEQARLETVVMDEKAEDLKLIKSEVQIPSDAIAMGSFDMELYLGPNDYERLAAYDNGLEEIIPFGRSIFGTINRWIIRPFFNLLDGMVHNKGIAIILMIVIIKTLLYPLTYKMLKSQAKMGALKPELASLKEKYKDDAQTQQVETMKIYREYGVSPLGGCLPMLVQMPIWYALFRFFPASIDFRQESFMWADDLSSYDAFFKLPFEIPLLGAHLSLFTILWVVSQLIYTYYNTKHMDLSANPAMKYVQYFMPVMFLVFFNKYASGLTVYMFFSNLITIAQTITTKSFIFKEDKLRAELMKNKEKPKKKSKFQQTIETAMNQQKEAQAKKDATSSGKKKKK